MKESQFLTLVALLTQIKTEQRQFFLRTAEMFLTKKGFKKIEEAYKDYFANCDKSMEDIINNLDCDTDE